MRAKSLHFWLQLTGHDCLRLYPFCAALRQVEVAREQARHDHVPRSDVEAEVRGLQEQLELLEAEHSAQLKEAYRVRERVCVGVLLVAKQELCI